MYVAGTKLLEPSLLPPEGGNRKLELQFETKPKYSDMGYSINNNNKN